MILTVLVMQACCWTSPDPVQPALPAIAPMTAVDRIMIVAPHEDDEALAAGGLIQQAVAAGAAVRVVYLTYGDHNEIAFIVYRRKPWITPGINRNMGELRRKEALSAVSRLGVAPGGQAFLGYPDGGMLDIWREHWGQAKPLYSLLTNSRQVPYQDADSFGKEYKGENVASDLAREILAFKPTRILVGHPSDSHPDHRASWLFLQSALLELGDNIRPPEVLAYPVHAGRWPRPRGENPDVWLPVPTRLSGCGEWLTLELTPGQARLKAEAIRLYRTQTSVSAGYLLSFARRNELFARIEPIRLGRPPDGAEVRPHAWLRSPAEASLDEGAESSGFSPAPGDWHVAEPEPVGSVLWSDSGEALVVEVRLHYGIAAGAGVTAMAYGFRPDRPFAEMPKLQVSWEPGRFSVYDQGTYLKRGDVLAVRRPGALVITIPWKELGEPRKVFVQVGGSAGDLPSGQTGWKLAERRAAK